MTHYTATETLSGSNAFAFNGPNGKLMAMIQLPGGRVEASTICQMLEQAYARGVEDKGREIRERMGV